MPAQPRESRGDGDPFAALPGWMRGLAVRLSPSGIGRQLQRRLDLAGNPGRWTPDRVLAVKGLGLLVLAALGALYGLHSPGLLILCVLGSAALSGSSCPTCCLYNSGQKRQAKIQMLLPDAMDMLTICVEAGLGFDAALAQVARNTDRAAGRRVRPRTAGDADRQVAQPGAAGDGRPDHRPRIAGLRLRPGPGERTGHPVAQVLREQAKEMRVQRRQRAEETGAAGRR